MSIPFGYTHVSAARNMDMGRKYLNFIAIVLDVRPPKETKHGYTTSFTISDTQGDPYSGLPIRFFRTLAAIDGLPPVETGDIILLRSILVGEYMQSVSGVVPQYVTCPWVVFRKDPYSQSLLRIAESSRRYHVTPAEYVYINALAGVSNANPVAYNPPVPPAHSYSLVQSLHSTPVVRPPQKPQPRRPAPPKSGKKDKFSLIQNLRDYTFVDLAGYVVRMSSGPPGGCLVYLTDYTENDMLEDHSGNGDWPGPFGRRTFAITLWDDNADWASENVDDNDIIRLFNVNVKERYGLLEGRLHSETSGKLKIYKIDSSDQDDERISQLAHRKQEYWKKRKSELREMQEKKSTAAFSALEKRKARKKAQQQKDLEAKKQKRDEDQPEIKAAIQQPPLKKREILNQNVEAWNPSQRIYPLRDIIDNEHHDNTTPDGIRYRLPFQNVRYRTTVRVVDYLPHRLEDFAIRCSTDRQFMGEKSSHEAKAPQSDNDGSEEEFDTHSSYSWVWRFCLLVEDATERLPAGSRRPRIPLFVSGEDAEHLLCLDAKDLREDEHTPEALRNKLFLLWGNLQELKEESITRNEVFDPDRSVVSLKSLPFSCCIKEYGVRVADISVKKEQNAEPSLDLGWKKRFRMFGTKIMGS